MQSVRSRMHGYFFLGGIMKLLYCTWQENSKGDCINALETLGHSVSLLQFTAADYDNDDSFEEILDEKLKEGFDAVFSFNFLPVVSKVVQRNRGVYLSWVYDSPHYTLQSKMLDNSCNRIFIFDRALCEQCKTSSNAKIIHMPLAADTRRLHAFNDGRYFCDISFVGSLYNGSKNLYNCINYLPQELLGYLDGVSEAAMRIYGYDLTGDVVDKEVVSEVRKYVTADLPCDYKQENRDEIIRNILRINMTSLERKRVLEKLSRHFKVNLYSESQTDIPVNCCGTVDYYSEMPKIFAGSKINLNITLRSILSGIPLRVVDILATGGFLITNFQSELCDYFSNDEDIVWYESEEELLQKVRYYLRADTQREKIAQKGYEKACEYFDIKKILPQILGCI